MSKNIKKGFEIHKVKDGFDSAVRINHDTLFPLPFKLLICGKSLLSAKSSLVVNLLLKPNGYKDTFKGENIYIVSPSTEIDKKYKMIQRNFDIPEYNIFEGWDDTVMEEWFEDREKDAIEERKETGKISPILLLLDDVGFSGDLKKKQLNGILSKIICNGRHIGISLIITTQKYTQASNCLRENLTSLAVSSCSNSQLETIYEDNSIISKKQFYKIFREATREKYSWFWVDFVRKSEDRYLDTNLNPIPIDLLG